MKERNPNRLINELSPYLLQHAYNPVDWYPWGEEAFKKAELENKPIFLSIGYSTCHWCHVMERESFEDEEVASLMNEIFVSIKVDREERPDIDHVYMTACQLMTGNGGWPLSIVMTPNKKPFFSGTYFPKENRYGQIGFKDLIKNIHRLWNEKRIEIDENAEMISDYLNHPHHRKTEIELNEDILKRAYSYFDNKFDQLNGGFGDAPKFPTPHNLMFLLRYWKRFNESGALEMVVKTLRQMRKGGIYDHVGFGFHRYSTDKQWLVPHFEKMLYDQALLIYLYTEAYLASGASEFKTTVEDNIKYVLRDMTSLENGGGFYSAEDADSGGEEGKFYVWTKDEIFNALDKNEAEIFCDYYNITDKGNFLDESTRTLTGQNIPHIVSNSDEIINKYKIDPADFMRKIKETTNKLYAERNKRMHPLKDDKILTDWNGLMIAALSFAGRSLNNIKYIEAAEK